MIIGSVIGICVYNPSMNLPSFTSFAFMDGNGNISYLFPTLFVTIACGAVSGFHSLVSSGTASKQIKNEKNMLPVSFGAMLLESLLAITALIAVGALATGGTLPTGTPPQVFAKAIAMFLTSLGLPDSVSYTLITLSISAFALTSLDSVARVGRIAFQEFFTNDDVAPENQGSLNRVLTNKYFSTILTLALCYALSRAGYGKHLAPVRLCQPAAVRTGADCMRRVLKEDPQTGRDALGTHGHHAGRYLYGPGP